MAAISTCERLLHVYRESGSDYFQVYFKFISKSTNTVVAYNNNRKVDESVVEFLTHLNEVISTYEEKMSKNKGARVDLDVRLLRDSVDVGSEENCIDVFFTKEANELRLKIGDVEYQVTPDLPVTIKLVMPKSIVFDCPLFPKSLKIFNGDIDNSEIQWLSSSDNGKTWNDCGSSIIHYPKNDGATHYKMTIRPGNGKHFGPKLESKVLKDVKLVTTFNKSYDNFSNFNELRVLSYNLLAKLYAKTIWFAHCPLDALSMDYRKPLLLREILGYKADIICLQEVDVRFFKKELSFLLKMNDYIGFMDAKLNTAEGVALFFHKDKFRMIDKKRFVFGNELRSNALFNHLRNTVQRSRKLFEKVVNLGTVLQIVVLEPVHNSGHYIVVGNTHLYSHPSFANIRLIQSAIAVKICQEIIKTYEEKGKVSLIFCGDFNSTPDSGVYQLMTQKFIPSYHKEWTSDKKADEMARQELRHDLDIKSAYQVSSLLTNFTPSFSGCLDYIYYTYEHISVSETVELPNKEFLEAQIGLPNASFPSDHLPICSTFKWI